MGCWSLLIMVISFRFTGTGVQRMHRPHYNMLPARQHRPQQAGQRSRTAKKLLHHSNSIILLLLHYHSSSIATIKLATSSCTLHTSWTYK